MPVHDWTRVSSGIFHHFHLGWVAHLSSAINNGILPANRYCLVRQPPDPPSGEDALDESATYRRLRRTIGIYDSHDHTLVALVEIASPGVKDSAASVASFVTKVVSALKEGIHVLLVDILPPGDADPNGLHSAIWKRISGENAAQAGDPPLSLVAYEASRPIAAYVEPVGVGSILPDMPLFLEPGYYVNVPLERTYEMAYRGVPEFWREVIEGKRHP